MARITLDGRTYEADDATLAQMDKDGVKYAPAHEQGGGFWQNAADALRGGAHGLSVGIADAKFGDANESLMQRAGLDDYDKVKERSPVLTTVGDLAGSVVNPLGELGMAAKGASLAARVGRGMLGSGVESLVREAADEGQGGSPTKALEAGGIGALIGGVIPGIGAGIGALGKTEAVQKLGGFLGDITDKAADTMRNKAAGLGAREMKDLGEKTGLHGNELAAYVAKEQEALAPSPQANLKPGKDFTLGGQTVSDRAETLLAQREASGKAIGDSLDEAGSAEGLDAFLKPSDNGNNPGTWAQIQQRLAQDAAGLKNASPKEQMVYNAANGFSDRLANEAAPDTLGGLHKRVSDWGKEAYPQKGGISNLSDSAAGQAAEMGRDVGRDELGKLVSQYATPETVQKFEKGMGDYSRVADYARAAETRANIEAANSNFMGSAVIPAVAGIGGFVTGGIPGAAVGLGMAAHSGTRSALRQAAETSRGYDIAANAGRALAPKLKSADRLVQGLGEALAKQGNRKGAVALEGDVAPAFVGPDMEDEERQRRAALGYGSR
jgi:hypothetical protein